MSDKDAGLNGSGVPAPAEAYQWIVRRTIGDGLVNDTLECPPIKTTGGWQILRTVTGADEHTIEFSMGVTSSHSNSITSSSNWQESVSKTVTKSVSASVGGEFKGVSGSVSGSYETSTTNENSWGGAFEDSISRAVSHNSGEVLTATFGQGTVWQWRNSIQDFCGEEPWQLKTDNLALTEGANAPPCCIPGLELIATQAHGPCMPGTPCFCSEHVCDQANHMIAEEKLKDLDEQRDYYLKVLSTAEREIELAFKIGEDFTEAKAKRSHVLQLLDEVDSETLKLAGPPPPVKLVAASIGTCNSFLGKAHVHTMTADCLAIGGNSTHTQDISRWTLCELDLCDASDGTTNGRAYAPGRMNQCHEKAALGIILIPKEKCDEMGGAYNGKHFELVDCHLDWCALDHGRTEEGGILVPSPYGALKTNRFSSGGLKLTKEVCDQLGGTFRSDPENKDYICILDISLEEGLLF